MPVPKFKRPTTTSGDMNVPTQFFSEESGGFLPSDEPTQVEKYFCMAELYEASIKDYDNVNTEDAEYVVTIIIPNPYTDYLPLNEDLFTVDLHMYKNAKFRIQNIAPNGENNLKLVGVSYKNN